MNNITKKISSIGLLLPIVSIYAFLYIPIFVLIIFSFNRAPFPAPWIGFSLKWYEQLFASSAIWVAFRNSVIIAFSAMLLSTSMTLGFIYHNISTRTFTKFLPFFYGTIIVPELVLAVGLLSFLSLMSIPLGIITLIVAHTVLALGYALPIIYTRFQTLDKRIVEASLDLGATTTQTFFRVVLPYLMPAIIASGLLIFIISFDDFVLSYFCAGSDSQTLPLYIFSMIRSGGSPVINALSTLLLLLSGLLVLIFCSLNIKTKIF